MPSPLLHRVHDVQAAAYRLTLICGLARFAAVAILSVIGLGLVDYLLRFHDPIARWLIPVSLLALLATSFLKLVVPVLRSSQNMIATARRIERRFPELDERLSSAVAFLGKAVDDPTAGSGDLRRAVIAEAEARVAHVDLGAALDGRASRRALAAGGMAFLIAFTIAVIDPGATGLALSRILAPWRNLPWPRKHELAFVNAPSRLPKGEDFEVVLVDRGGVLPDDLQVQIRQRASSGTAVESRHIQALGGQAVFRLDNVTSGFEYRARGGDDDTMPWLGVVLVEPPKILELQIVVHPPAYTGLATRVEGPVVTALIGSTLEIRGKVDQPIQLAGLKSVLSGSAEFTLDVASDGRTFSAPATSGAWSVEQSDALDLEVTDQQGMVFGHSARIELHALKDQPPSIAWDAPAENVFVTASAALPIQATVKDDLAVHSVQLRCLRPRKIDEEEVVELYIGPEVRGRGQPSRAIPSDGSGESDVHAIHSTCDLSSVAGLEAGDALAMRITAEDYKPQLTTTSILRITVITNEEFVNRIAARQSAVLAQLGEALRMARQCREQTRSLEEQIRERGHTAADLSALEAARYSLQQVQRLVGGGSEGAVRQIDALLEELTANRMEQESASQRLRGLLKQVQSLQDQSLPAIDQALTDVLKLIRESDPENDSVVEASGGAIPHENAVVEQLRKAGEREEEIIQALEQLTGALTQWDSFARIAGEISQMRVDQSRLAEDTDDLKLRAVAGDREGSTIRAAGRQLSQRQLELARRLDKMQTRMEETIARAMSDDSRAAPKLADGLDTARRLAIGGRMREAAALLSQFQLNPARQTEQEALDALTVLLRALSRQRDSEGAFERQSQLEQIVAELAERQKKVISETNRLDKERGSAGAVGAAHTSELKNLTAEQRRLADDTARVKDRFVDAEAFAFAIETAASDMRRAGDLLHRGETTAVTQEVERAALVRLEQMLSALGSEASVPRDQATAEDQGQQSRQENPGPSPAEIKLVRLFQQRINQRTVELEAIRVGMGNLSPEQQHELDALAHEQGRLAEMVLDWIKTASQSPDGDAK
jgi:hypothetical protein